MFHDFFSKKSFTVGFIIFETHKIYMLQNNESRERQQKNEILIEYATL